MKSLKSGLTKWLHPSTTKFKGEHELKEPESNMLDDFFLLLQQINFLPQHIVDVGANQGNWTRKALKYFPDAQYTLIEPQQWLEVHVKDILQDNSGVKFYPLGAGKTEGSFKFTLVDRNDSSTFLLSEEEAKKMGFNQIDVEVVTLNKFIHEKNLPIPDMIKIDAEGLDLEVLDGSTDFFGKTEVFLVEAAVVSKYIKNDFFSVVSYMKGNGYKLFEITDINRPFVPKVLWLMELVFIRQNGLIDSKNLVQLPY